MISGTLLAWCSKWDAICSINLSMLYQDQFTTDAGVYWCREEWSVLQLMNPSHKCYPGVQNMRMPVLQCAVVYWSDLSQAFPSIFVNAKWLEVGTRLEPSPSPNHPLHRLTGTELQGHKVLFWAPGYIALLTEVMLLLLILRKSCL